MKWLGQYIQSFTARFRNDVYLEDISTGTIASGGNLGLDSNNKIVKATVSSGSGDIESVSLVSDSGTINALTGAVTFTIEGGTNISTSATGSTLTINNDAAGDITDVRVSADDDVISMASGSAAFTIAGGEGIDTSAASTTITIAGENASTSNKGIASFSEQNFAVSSGAVTIKDEGVDLSQNVTGTLPGSKVQAASLTNVGAVELATTGEADTGTDATRAVTPAGLKSHVDSRYSTSYITFSAKSTSSYGTNYVFIHANGISESTFSVDSGVDSAGDFGKVETEQGNAAAADAVVDVPTATLEQQIPIPETCKLIGFFATSSTTTNSGAAYDTGVAIWHIPEANINWGGSVAGQATLIHKSDSSMHSENTSHSGTNRKKVQMVKRMDGTVKDLAAGDILIPSIFGETSNQQILASITLVIATPIKTIT